MLDAGQKQIRNPKHEILNKPKIQISNVQNCNHEEKRTVYLFTLNPQTGKR